MHGNTGALLPTIASRGVSIVPQRFLDRQQTALLLSQGKEGCSYVRTVYRGG